VTWVKLEELSKDNKSKAKANQKSAASKMKALSKDGQ
jgi:hypothetical protein